MSSLGWLALGWLAAGLVVGLLVGVMESLGGKREVVAILKWRRRSR